MVMVIIISIDIFRLGMVDNDRREDEHSESNRPQRSHVFSYAPSDDYDP